MRKEKGETQKKRGRRSRGGKREKGEVKETSERREGRETGGEKGMASLGTRPEDAGWGLSLGTHLYMMLCRIEAKGVMPMPAPMSTACSEAKILRVGVPYGPSM